MGMIRLKSFLQVLVVAAVCAPRNVWGKEPPNAGGYFCKGCSVVMEHTFHDLNKKMERLQGSIAAGVEKEIKINIREEIVLPLCEKNSFQAYTKEIKDACKQIVSKNAHVVDHAFKGFRQNYNDLYKRTNTVCVQEMNLCSGEPSEIDLGNKCEVCLGVVQDIQAVLTRKKGSKDYLTRKHIWSSIEAECQEIVFRFDGRVGRKMQSMCENLLDDYEEEIADAFFSGNENPGKLICGKAGARMCKKRKGDWVGKLSPWSQVQVTTHNEL
jgi:hypothetical protein